MPTRSPALLTCAITGLGWAVGGCSCGGGGAGNTAQTARQALVAAATRTQQVTSASETLLVRVSGAPSQTTTGTILVQLKPTVQISESIKITAGGTNTGIKAIVTSNAFYLSEPTFSKQFGKRWLKINLNALTGTAGANVGEHGRSIQ